MLSGESSCYEVVCTRILCRAPDDERLDSFETCRADKNCGIKIGYKNEKQLDSPDSTIVPIVPNGVIQYIMLCC